MMEEKLKQIVKELKKKAEEWNETYDDMMLEDMEEDVREIFRKYGFEILERRDRGVYKSLYKETNRGLEEVFGIKTVRDPEEIPEVYGVIEYLLQNGFKLFSEIRGFYTDSGMDVYQIYYKGSIVIVVRKDIRYGVEDNEVVFYHIVDAFTHPLT